MTVPRILVVGAETYTDAETVVRVLEHSYATLRAASRSTPILVTMRRTFVDATAIAWCWSKGMLVDPKLPFRSKYVHINSLVSDGPDLMLVFGSDKITKRAVEGARRGAVEIVEIAE